jgi:hypothetical protein
MSAPVATDSSKNSPMPPQNEASFFDRVHQRAQRRKNNPWNLLLALFCLIAVVGTWIGLVRLFHSYRGSLIPADAFLFAGTRIGNIFMFVTPLFASIAVGFIVGNSLAWCIAPARTAFNKEAAGVEGEDFQSAQLGLAKVGIIALIVTLPICLLGANNFWALTPSGIDYRPMLAATTQHYAWSSVEQIETGCSTSKDNVDYHFVLTLNDKTRVDLMEEESHDFLAAYPKIQLGLTGHRYRFNSWVLGVNCRPRQEVRTVLSQPPTE